MHVTAAYKPAVFYGGPTMSVAALCEELVRDGHFVEVFTTTANGNTELDVIPGSVTIVDGVPVTYFKRITKDHTHFSPALLAALWKRAKEFDVIHIHAWWNLVSVLGGFVAALKKVPVVVSPRGMLSNYTFGNKNIGAKQLIHGALGKNLLNKSHIHVTSPYEAKAVEGLLNPLSVTDIPNFVKLGSEAAKPGQAMGNTGAFKLLFFSRIEEKKGLEILLDALSLINILVTLTIAGNGRPEYIQQLKNRAKTLGIEDKISWAGFHDAEKFELLSAHHLMVLPSYDENFGNVVVEALSVGTAVLLSEHVGLADYVLQNKLGWVFTLQADELAATISDIYTSRQQELEKIRQMAPAVVKADFTGSLLTQKYIQFYRQILSQ